MTLELRQALFVTYESLPNSAMKRAQRSSERGAMRIRINPEDRYQP